MEPLSLVIYHNDPRTAQALVVSLSQYFGSVNRVNKYEEVRSAVTGYHADVLVLDMESSRSDAVGRLHQEFPSLRIVATHRLADDQLWTEAMNQGAADVCRTAQRPSRAFGIARGRTSRSRRLINNHLVQRTPAGVLFYFFTSLSNCIVILPCDAETDSRQGRAAADAALEQLFPRRLSIRPPSIKLCATACLPAASACGPFSAWKPDAW